MNYLIHLTHNLTHNVKPCNMINFSLFGQPTRKNNQTTIYLRINCDSQKVRISTKLTIPKGNWNQEAQTVVKGGDFDFSFYREKLTKIVNTVESVTRTANLEEWNLEKVQREIQGILGKSVAPAKKKGVLALYQEWAYYGTATKITPRASDRLTYNVFKEFLQDKEKSFDEIDYKFYSDFVLFLRQKKEYKENSVGSHIRNLKAVMEEGLKRRLHSNMDFKSFQRPQEEIVNINLTELEIKKIYSLKLKDKYEQVRDIFVFGCYVAQRHSDYSRISQNDVKDGYIEILQKKTSHRIRIPFHPIAKEILNKYNGHLPKIDIQHFNALLKDIAQFAKLKEKVKVVETKAGKKVEKEYEKWQLVTSHTARKSGVTNALRAGVPIEDCMYLAGIKSPATFRKYAGIADNEYSERLANSKFFTGNPEVEELIRYAAKIIRSGEEPFWLQRLKGAYRNDLRKK